MLDIKQKIQIAESRINTRAFDRLQDDMRLIFLDRLHVAAQDIEKVIDGVAVIQSARIRLTDWERHFVADLVRERRELTNPQREKIDELRHRYQSRL